MFKGIKMVDFQLAVTMPSNQKLQNRPIRLIIAMFEFLGIVIVKKVIALSTK